MATTSNYGWTIPDDTDLVKNGALAIRTLGNAIDSTAATSFGGGLVHLNTTSFTTSSAESFNDVFSSTYDGYRIILIGTASSAIDINFRLRASGTDNSTASSYVQQRLLVSNTTVNGARATSNLWQVGVSESTLKNSTIIDIFDPFKAQATAVEFSNVYANSGAYIISGVGTHNQTVSYDGFSLIPASGTFSGSISIYGYRKS